MPFVQPSVKEEKRYGEKLEERKANDIFTKASTSQFMNAPRPEAHQKIAGGQNEMELQSIARKTAHPQVWGAVVLGVGVVQGRCGAVLV